MTEEQREEIKTMLSEALNYSVKVTELDDGAMFQISINVAGAIRDEDIAGLDSEALRVHCKEAAEQIRKSLLHTVRAKFGTLPMVIGG